MPLRNLHDVLLDSVWIRICALSKAGRHMNRRRHELVWNEQVARVCQMLCKISVRRLDAFLPASRRSLGKQEFPFLLATQVGRAATRRGLRNS